MRNTDTRFGMKRRDMMKLVSLVMIPLMPGVANSATLIYGERDAVLVDTFLTVEQSSGLADAIVASGKTLKAIYVTHAHGDHFFGIKVLQDQFPNAKALATPAVVEKMKLQIA